MAEEEKQVIDARTEEEIAAESEEKVEVKAEDRPEIEDKDKAEEKVEDKAEDKIDPIKEKRKNNQDRAWERVIEKNARMAARLEQLEQQVTQQQVQKTQQDAPVAPKREDYTEIGDYLEAKQDFNNLVLQSNMERRLAQMQQATQPEPTETSWDQAEEAARAKYPDYDDIVDDAKNVMVPEVAIQAIQRSPIGPDLTYHLAKHPEDAQKLSRMKVAGDQIFFLGQLAGRLTEAKTQKPKVSAAPKPISPEKPGGGGVETNRDKLSDKEWFALYSKERKAKLTGKT